MLPFNDLLLEEADEIIDSEIQELLERNKRQLSEIQSDFK